MSETIRYCCYGMYCEVGHSDDCGQARKVTAAEDKFLRSAARKASTLVAPGKLVANFNAPTAAVSTAGTQFEVHTFDTPSIEKRAFQEWFHAAYLKAFGPVNTESTYSRMQHRELKTWCETAWLEARATAPKDTA